MSPGEKSARSRRICARSTDGPPTSPCSGTCCGAVFTAWALYMQGIRPGDVIVGLGGALARKLPVSKALGAAGQGLLLVAIAAAGSLLAWLLVAGLVSSDATERSLEQGAEPLAVLTESRILAQQSRTAETLLLANVAHELNNPLAVATVQLDNLQEAWGAGAWAEDLAVLRQAVDRCTSVVQSFLALARQQPPTRQAVALNAVIGDVLVLLGPALAADGITVQLHLADDLMPLWADANQLHHVVSNLLTNAHDALRQAAPPRHLTLTTAASADRTQVLLTVTDTGPGIPEDLQRRVFEPFFTTKSQRGGSGLGLPLCRSMVEGHHGSIRLTSRPGQGTTVHVALPATAPEVQAPEAAPDLAAPAPAPGGAVLLIDDEAIIVQSLRRLLQRDGHEVTTAATGLEGLAALETRAYEVILCDMRMPDLDGPGFYRELHRRHPHLVSRVIFLTGDVLSPDAQAFFTQTARPHVVKPFNAREIRRVIRQVLEAP